MIGFARLANERGDGAGVFARNVDFTATKRARKTTTTKACSGQTQHGHSEENNAVVARREMALVTKFRVSGKLKNDCCLPVP